jgi:hypothetical protein
MYEVFAIIICLVIVLSLGLYYVFKDYSMEKSCSPFTYKNGSNDRTDFFTVKVNDIYGVNRAQSLEETYAYPCDDCLNVARNNIRPYSIYNLSEDRCVKNPTNTYINKADLDSINNYTSTYNNDNLIACSDAYNTLTGFITGRYIKIARTSGNLEFKMNHISVHARAYTSLYTGAFIYASHMTSTGISTYSYPSKILNSDSGITFSTIPSNSGYIMIDLLSNREIGFIDIKHANAEDAATLGGSTITVYKAAYIGTSTIVDTKMGEKLLVKNIPTNTSLNLRIYLQSRPGTTTGIKESIIQRFPFTSGTTSITNFTDFGCAIGQNCLIMNYEYTADTRCFIPTQTGITSNNLDLAFNKTISEENMDNFFRSCVTDDDTRKASPLGRWVRIQNEATTLSDVIITRIAVYGMREITGTAAFLRPVEIFVSKHTSDTDQNNYVSLAEATSTATSRAVVNGANRAYIELDLGGTTDFVIKRIVINPFIDTSGVNGLTNSVLYIIKNDRNISYRRTLNSILATNPTPIITPFVVNL